MASPDRHSVVAVAVSYLEHLLSARYSTSAVLARVRVSRAVSAAVGSLVAAVRLALACRYRLGARFASSVAPVLRSRQGFAT